MRPQPAIRSESENACCNKRPSDAKEKKKSRSSTGLTDSHVIHCSSVYVDTVCTRVRPVGSGGAVFFHPSIEGLEASLLRYKAGTVLDGGDVDLVLDFADGEDAADVDGHPSTGLAKASSDLGTLSSQEPKGEGIGILVGVIAGVVALVGGATAVAPSLLGALRQAGIYL